MRFRFGAFTLDLDTRQLLTRDRVVHLAPKAFDLLTALVLDRPKVLSKKALLERLWPDTFVSEANLSNILSEVREALGDNARSPSFVRTAHGFGYAFCGEATTLPDGGDPAPDSCGCWIEWGTRRFPLSAGQNVIGRDPDVEVRLDASTVSRRHASLVVKADGTVLEDRGSKNGTFHGGERISGPVRVADGDAISIGSVLVTFRARAGAGSTETAVTPSL